jgi:hypothetical protein
MVRIISAEIVNQQIRENHRAEPIDGSPRAAIPALSALNSDEA